MQEGLAHLWFFAGTIQLWAAPRFAVRGCYETQADLSFKVSARQRIRVATRKFEGLDYGASLTGQHRWLR